MNTEHHMLASAESAHFVSSSPLIALVTVSAESQTPVGDGAGSSSGTPLPSAFNDNNHFDINMTTVILIIVCLFPLLGVFVFYVNRRCAPHAIPPRQPDVDRVAGQKNQGLDPEFIETFPVVSYSTASMAKHSTDCAVCLTEFQEGERTRLLPRCNHAFHPECIDMWLFSHSTCPLCRIVLISESHAITILSNPPQLSARQEDPDGAVLVIEMGLEAPSEAIVERAREREAVLSGSRSSQSCPQAASEMDNGERLLATSATHSSSITVDERSPSSRWIGRLRRSCSMEGSRSSAKVENPDSCREPSAKE